MVTCDDNKNEVQKTSTLPKRLSNTHNIDLLGKKILVCGVRGTGKTFLIRDIFNKLKNQVDKIYIVSPYEKAEHIYERENESHKAKIFLNISELPSINFNNKKTKLIIIDSAFGSGSTYIYEKKFQNMLEDKNTTLIF